MHATTTMYYSPQTQVMKTILLLPPAFSLLMTTYGLEINWHYVALVVGSTFAGALVLGYYRPEKTTFRSVYKAVISMAAGVVVGSAIVTWRGLEQPAYVSLAYCISSMVVLFLLKSIIGYGEKNADSLTKTVLQRIFNVKKDDCPDVHVSKGGTSRPRRPKPGGVHIASPPQPGDKPVVVIDDDARPDEVRVIEQTVIDTKGEQQ